MSRLDEENRALSRNSDTSAWTDLEHFNPRDKRLGKIRTRLCSTLISLFPRSLSFGSLEPGVDGPPDPGPGKAIEPPPIHEEDEAPDRSDCEDTSTEADQDELASRTRGNKESPDTRTNLENALHVRLQSDGDVCMGLL